MMVVRTTTEKRVPRKPRNKKGKGKAPGNQKKTQRNKPPRTMFHLSECSERYLKALTAPFDFLSSDVCVPDLYDTPSQKVRTRQRGILQTGTAGIGFVEMDVFYAAIKDVGSIMRSDATFTGDSFADPSDVGTQESLNTQALYNLAQLGPGESQIQFRVVAAGLRVRYNGTELNKAGNSIPFSHPTNQPIKGISAADALSYNEIEQYAVTRAWKQVTWVPTKASHYEYQSSNANFSLTLGSNGNTIGIMVSGPAANFWDWEAVLYVEYTGAVANVTPSHSDISGMSAIRGFVEHNGSRKAQGNVYAQAQDYIRNLAPKDLSGWVDLASRGARAAAPMLQLAL
jgi:hypothetical protein